MLDSQPSSRTDSPSYTDIKQATHEARKAFEDLMIRYVSRNQYCVSVHFFKEAPSFRYMLWSAGQLVSSHNYLTLGASSPF